MTRRCFLAALGGLVAVASTRQAAAQHVAGALPQPGPGRAAAVFAGGCFWCMEPPFDALEGVVDAHRARWLVPRRVGGIDFALRNPFAVVWGTLDRDRVLWLTGDHHRGQRPLSDHPQHLPRAGT